MRRWRFGGLLLDAMWQLQIDVKDGVDLKDRDCSIRTPNSQTCPAAFDAPGPALIWHLALPWRLLS
jgi:hypothetical protein